MRQWEDFSDHSGWESEFYAIVHLVTGKRSCGAANGDDVGTDMSVGCSKDCTNR